MHNFRPIATKGHLTTIRRKHKPSRQGNREKLASHVHVQLLWRLDRQFRPTANSSIEGRGLTTEVGFKSFKIIPLAGPASTAVTYK